MSDLDANWFSSLQSALAVGERVCQTSSEFDEACEHVVSLLRDSETLLAKGSHATAAFLAITALEETAKVHIGMSRFGTSKLARRYDPLHHHKEKHILALGPTVSMGKRLQKAIGSDRLQKLINDGRTSSFARIRESALYVEQSERGLTTPKIAISPTLACELLLLAIEVFDDALVGNTNQSFRLSDNTDHLFELVATQHLQSVADKSKRPS